jgi:hypothetical protein
MTKITSVTWRPWPRISDREAMTYVILVIFQNATIYHKTEDDQDYVVQKHCIYHKTDDDQDYVDDRDCVRFLAEKSLGQGLGPDQATGLANLCLC